MIEDGLYEEEATQNSLLTFTSRTTAWQANWYQPSSDHSELTYCYYSLFNVLLLKYAMLDIIATSGFDIDFYFDFDLD